MNTDKHGFFYFGPRLCALYQAQQLGRRKDVQISLDGPAFGRTAAGILDTAVLRFGRAFAVLYPCPSVSIRGFNLFPCEIYRC